MSHALRPNEAGKRNVALVYVRLSVTKNKSDEISPQRQLALCTEEAERHGWIVEAYKDAEGHRSGGSEAHRPEWRRLKLQLSRPEIVAVVVADISRAGRARRDLYNFLHEIEQRGIVLIDLRYKLDTTTAAGRLMLGMLINVLAWEREVDSERAFEAIQFKRSRGKHVGNAPFGCKRDDHGLLVPNDDWATCERVLELYASGGSSFYSLPYQLNALGFRFRNRKGEPVPFDRSSVRSIVSNILVYAGYIPHGHGKDMGLPRVLDASDPIGSLVEYVGAIKAQHAPLISADLAARIIRVRHKTMRQHGDVTRRVFVLAGAARCANCGGRLRGFTIGGASRYLHEGRVCKVRKGVWDAATVEQRVLDELRALRLTPYQRMELKRRIEDKLREVPEHAEALATIRNLEAKLDRLRSLYIEGDVPRDAYDTQKRATIQAIDEQRSKLGPRTLNIEGVFAQLDSLADILAQGTPLQQRRAIGDLFSEIHLDFSGAIVRMVPRAWVSVVYGQTRAAHQVNAVAET